MLLTLALALAQERYDEDFENRQSLDVVYDHWERVRSPEHPAYNTLVVELDPAGARSGRHVLRLVTRGGAVALRMTTRAAWRVDPARPYRLTVHARISGATRNAAAAAVEWLDRRHEILREDVSAPLAAAAEWTPIALDIPAPPPTAVWARVRLQYGGGDVRGECRFDALSLEATTRLEIAPAGRISPIFEPGTPIRFEITVRGLAAGEYRLTTRTRAADGAEAHRAGALAIRPDRPCLVEIPPHPPGYYDLIAEIAGPSGPEIRAESPLVVPNGWIFRPRAPRWIGMSINLFSREVPDAAAFALLAGCDRARVTFSDRPPAGRGEPDAARLSDVVRLLAMPDQARVTGVLARPSAALYPDQDVEALGHLFTPLRRDAWEGPLKALAGRYAGVVDAWEVGELRLDADLRPRPEPGPVTLPVVADSAAFVRTLLERAAAADRPEAPVVALDAPLLDAAGRPRPALVAIRALNDLLSGSKVWRDAPTLLNVRELAFEKEGLTILAFWNPVETEREAHLGDGAIVYPPLGAARPHRPGERLRIGPMPLLVVKRDDVVFETQAGLQFYAPGRPESPDSTLPLRVDPVTRVLRFRNLSPDETLSDVRVRLLEPLPAGWQIRPLEMRAATLPPRAEISQDTLFILPAGAGERSLDLPVELAFRKGGVEQRVRLTRTIEARSAIGIDVVSTPDGAQGRKVSVRFSNKESRPISFLARVRLPGLPERAEPVGPLDVGAVHTLDFTLRDFHLVDPTRRIADVFCEEPGGERARARLTQPLK
ncbi:MAG TPA: hypothetical protein VF950_27920 [Planctomycetota bacterium]